jgi:hypothetical protein
MQGGRWGSFRGLGIAGTVVAAGIALGVSTPAHGACIPPVISCPSPPAPTTGPPQAKILGVNDVTATSAVFTADINPEGLATTYSWGYMYSDGYGTFLPFSHDYTLPAGSSSVQIQTNEKLKPGSEYSSLVLNVSNADGSTQANWLPTFTTPEHPRLQLQLRREVTTIGSTFPVKVRVSGTYSSVAAVKFYVSPSPFRRWLEADGDVAPIDSRDTVTAQPCVPKSGLPCRGPDRNYRLKATLGPGTSRTRLIYVLPAVGLTSVREKYGYSPWLDVTFAATVHAMRRYPRALVYFYASGSRRGPLIRVGSSRFRVALRMGYYGTQLDAKLRVYSRTAVYLYACYRHRLVSDMGPRYTLAKCGRFRY